MFIKRIEFNLYKPLMHAGTSFISITDIEDVIIIIGENGSGKSTLLKELTPLPAISTDFEDEGYKLLEIEHDDSTYIISSTFEKKKGIHSFIKDNVELNISGTSTVQQDLCCSELGITSIIKDIISGSIKICTMGRSERKQLLLSCYPSNLSFLLSYYKKITSELRSTKDNLKLLNSRKIELEHLALSQEAYDNMLLNSSELIKLKNDVEHIETIYLEEIKHMKSHDAYDTSITELDYVSIKERIQKIYNKLVFKYINDPAIFKEDIKISIPMLVAIKDVTINDIDTIMSDIHDINLEIDRYEQMSKELSEDRIREYNANIKSLTEKIDNIETNDKLMILPLDTTRVIDLKIVQKHLVQIHSTGEALFTQIQYDKLVSEINILSNDLAGYNRELNNALSILSSVQKRLEQYKKAEFNKTCTLKCPARDKYKENINSLEQEELSILENIEEYNNKIMDLSSTIEEKKELIDKGKHTVPSIEYIEKLLHSLNIYEYIVGKESFIDILKIRPMSIYNTLNLLITNSYNVYEKNSLKEQLENIKQKLEIVLESKKTTTDTIKVSIDKNKSKLSSLIDNHKNTKNKLVELEETLKKYTDMLNTNNELIEIKELFESNVLSHIINEKIKLIQSILNDLAIYKEIVEEEQINIKTILKDKENIKVRLEQEILPTIDKLSNELFTLDALEKALSPVYGIPHIYMTRFLNNLILIINSLIAQVWNYEMELVTLEEQDPLDYDFGVKLYNNNILKDINMLSEGQKEMVNLATIIGLFIIMGLGKIYPLQLDEIDSKMSEQHRIKLLELFSSLFYKKEIQQLFLVNHNAALYTSFNDIQLVCLNPEGITIPREYNTNVEIR